MGMRKPSKSVLKTIKEMYPNEDIFNLEPECDTLEGLKEEVRALRADRRDAVCNALDALEDAAEIIGKLKTEIKTDNLLIHAAIEIIHKMGEELDLPIAEWEKEAREDAKSYSLKDLRHLAEKALHDM